MSRRWPSIMVHIFCCLLLAVTVAHAVNTSPSDILTIPDRFDGQAVTLTGTITNVRERVSQRGNPYYTFDLSESQGRAGELAPIRE